MRYLWLASVLIIASAVSADAQTSSTVTTPSPQEEQAIRAVFVRFFDGWNTHDADKMVSIYAADIDHIDVFGEWHKGRETMRAELARLHAGPLSKSHKDYTVEKIRFLRPEIAVVQVSTNGTGGPNLGTYVLEKQSSGWLTVSFENVVPHDPPWKQ
jgi:uncharacterized protein (TIGR02246 family)